MVKVAVATPLLVYPLSAAIAFSVSVEVIAIGPLYKGDAVVGVMQFGQ